MSDSSNVPVMDKKELEKVNFEPFDIKVGRKTLTIEGHFLFGENSKIQELCSFEDLENNKALSQPFPFCSGRNDN